MCISASAPREREEHVCYYEKLCRTCESELCYQSQILMQYLMEHILN